MNLKSTIILFLSLLCPVLIFSQKANHQFSPNQLIVKGIVTDQASGQPMEFATVAILDKSDSSVVGGAMTDQNGEFELRVPKKDLIVTIEFISYESLVIDPLPIPEGGQLVDLGNLIMHPESTVLDDIEIVAERSETTFTLDKKVFTVGKDLANRGGTAEEILDNVPSVTVDIDGNVSLRGSEGVRLMIDGRPSSLAGVGNSNGLRSIPANLIEKVEVITNPSARYEAEGMAGIINIVLKKNQAGGFNGAIDANLGYPERAGLSANLNYRKNKLNWFANYGINHRTGPGYGKTIQDQLIYDDITQSEMRQISFQDREHERQSLSNSIRFGADYFFSEKEQLTASLVYRKSDDNNYAVLDYKDYLGPSQSFGIQELWTMDSEELKSMSFDNFEETIPSGNLYNITRRTDDEIEDENNLEYSLRYRKEFSSRQHRLDASVQFREKSETEGSIFENTEELFNTLELQRSNNAESDKSWLFRVDYVHPLGKDHKWEAGLLTSFKDIKNDYLVEDQIDDIWIPVVGLSNNFIYDEDVQSGYLIYGNTLNKFGFQAGLRGEHSIISTRLLQSEEGADNKIDYFNLFPSGHVNYNFTDKSALQLSYSRRVRRPRFWDLNPFFTFSDNRNFFSGNPYINPQFTDSYELGQIQYWDDVSLSASMFYRTTDASIQRTLIVDNTNGTTLRVPLNIGTVDDYGLDITVSFSGIKWLRLDGNWNIFKNKLSINSEDVFSEVYDYYKAVRSFSGDEESFNEQFDYALNETDNITWNGRITARFTFWDSDLQLRTNYRGARETSQGRRRGIASVDLGWSKDFINKKLTLTLSARDLFNSRKRNGFTLLDEYFSQSEFQWRARSLTLTASYRINQKKNRRRSGMNRGNGGFEGGGEEF
ncbi:MAG: TonB-dependent receptor [Saprospiraceae bacterium]|nr:TonB-dependent receptor [Saprospiraceae bacterium]